MSIPKQRRSGQFGGDYRHIANRMNAANRRASGGGGKKGGGLCAVAIARVLGWLAQWRGGAS